MIRFVLFIGVENLTSSMIMEEIFRMEDNGEQVFIQPLKDDGKNYDGKNYPIIQYLSILSIRS